MKIHWLLFLLCLFSLLNIYGEELNEYSVKIVKKIQTGNEEGMIGWKMLPGGFTGPSTFFVSNDRIFIPDRMNYRVNIYNRNLNFERTLKEKDTNEASATYKMKMDANLNMIYISTISGLVKIDSAGNRLFSTGYKNLSIKVRNQYNFFPINDSIFLYNDDNKIECITNKGEFLKGEKAVLEINKINEKSTNNMELPPDKNKIINDIQENDSLLIINNNFYSADFIKTKEYFNKIETVRQYISTQKKITSSKNIKLNISDFSVHFIGYDAYHNSYWDGSINKLNKIKKYAVIIYSKYGELLDAFYYGQYDNYEPNYTLYPTTGALIAVAPNGDVYFLTGNNKEYTFYKIENNW
ncbi:MAG: hypothetical protein JXB88_08890 [Spirochaetales bacterium]|nr:hypothetical protein [Spirochaetales bacterium]